MAVSRLVVANDLILADIFHKVFLHAITFLGLRDCSISLQDALYLPTDGHLSGTRWASARDTPETCHRTLDAFLLRFCAKDH